MAFYTQGGTLVLGQAVTIDLKKVLSGFGAETMVYLNNSGGASQILYFDDGVCQCQIDDTEQRVFTGLSSFTKVKIGGDGTTQGDYRIAISSELQPPIIKY